MARTEALIKAQQKQDEARKADPRLPSSRLSKEEGELMEKLYETSGSKKDAIVQAAKFYLENKK